MKKAAIIGTCALVAISAFVGFVFSEAAYRFILYRDNVERFVKPLTETVGVYDKSHWTYSQKFGYGYPPNEKINYTGISPAGIVTGCGLIDVINERGNIGPIEGDYEKSELKILLFGDSWAAFNINSTTWTDVFQRVLQERLKRPVHVVNFGRDGYGILQMFDLAAEEIEKWNPDLLIFSFITNDLGRLRTWRVPIDKDGRPDRVITHFEATENPDFVKAFDTFLIHPDATREWCENAWKRGTPDAVTEAILAKRQRLIEPTGELWADIYSLTGSYLFNRIFYGNPFRGIRERSAFPSMEIDDYALDSQFVRALKKVKSSGVPAILFHHAFYPEVVAGKEYIVDYKEKSLLNSLLRMTKFPTVETLENIDMPYPKPERMNASPTNFHPSLFGMKLYADALTRAFIDKGLLFELIPRLAGKK
jgi:hypothetical protein